MFFSIITVTYNAEKDIKKTLESIKSQSFKDYELLVIDGGSSDLTVALANDYRGLIDNMSISSESDNGIYDAMNKGVQKSKGEYIYFLNAGDFFVDCNVLSKVFTYIVSGEESKRKQKIYHGNMIRGGKVKTYPSQFYKWKWVYLEHAYFSHQAIFSPREALVDYPFDLTLKVCADRDWLIHCMENGYTYAYMDEITVASYAEGGVSSGFQSQQKDSLEISKRYGGKKAAFFVTLKRKFGEILGHER